MPSKPEHPTNKAILRRGQFIKLMGAGAAATVLPGLACTNGTAKRKPNIIFIMADDLGYGDLGSYGQTQILTPNLDRMAAEGMRFSDHYAGSTVCAPSRCCLMTGMHTGHAYVRGNRGMPGGGNLPLASGITTVADILKDAGYATALVGKWGLGEPDTEGAPNLHGFDHYFGYTDQVHAHNYYPEFLWRNGEKVPLGNKVKRPENRPDSFGGVATVRVDYSHDLMADEALSFIESRKDGPFFLYLALTIPHANNEAGAQGMEVPDDAPYTDENWPQQQKNIAAMITRMDRDIGRLFDHLKHLGLDDDTIVFFTSDNGPHREGGNDPDFFGSSGPLRGIKRDLYEGGIRVPMIVRWPGRIKAGAVSRHPSAFWDFLPTAAELAGAKVPPVDGISYAAALQGGKQQEHPYLYWEFKIRQDFYQAARVGPWKAFRKRPDAPVELYDLHQDSGETVNLAESHPEVVAQMEAIFDEARETSEFWPQPS